MLIQISSGQGPAECELAVGKLFQILQKEIPDLEIVHVTSGKKKDGFASLQCSSMHDLSGLEGSILWVCKSPYRPNHKRKNWYVDISILKERQKMEENSELRIETFRSGGKGGQHVNKVETGVRITHVATGLSASSTNARSQHMNKQLAMNRLCDMLASLERQDENIQKTLAWMENKRIERGNPIRVYEGLDFKRSK